MATLTLGKNLNYTLVGSILTLVVDLSQEQGLSASRKSTIIATTSGNKRVPGADATIGLNIYK